MKLTTDNKNAELIVYVSIIFILLTLSLVNIRNILTLRKDNTEIKVLGIETANNAEDKFWSSFLVKNPNYLPGLIETGKIDKAREIDPNFKGL